MKRENEVFAELNRGPSRRGTTLGGCLLTMWPFLKPLKRGNKKFLARSGVIHRENGTQLKKITRSNFNTCPRGCRSPPFFVLVKVKDWIYTKGGGNAVVLEVDY